MFIGIFFAFNCFAFINTQNYESENANSCVDSCSDGFSTRYQINLSDGYEENKDKDLVEILERSSFEQSNEECSKNVLMRIPFFKLTDGTVVRIQLEYGHIAKGTTIHIGNSPTNDLNGGDQETTLHNSEIYSNNTSFSYYLSSLSLCDQNYKPDDQIDLSKILLLNKSLSFINPRTKIAIYIASNWFRIDNLDRNSTLFYRNNYLFTFNQPILSNQCEDSYLSKFNNISPYLYIGLNRAIVDSSLLPGTGLCKADISFLNCYNNDQPDLEVNVTDLEYKLSDTENIVWTTPLGYLETSVMEHSPCSAQGVVKLKYDPANMRRVARFDLDFGEILSGFTFNIGDSPTNNAYGGDTGTTSNSAEIHSNDNRFYVWLNTKFCGDTLLYKIEYNLFQSNDKVTFFIGDQRIEINNHRGYHQIFKSPYLYNLNGQNVTCNCFDTRCYTGVAADFDVYFGINRVIGGTYRPGLGLCGAKISWLKCGGDFKKISSPLYSDDYKVVESNGLPKQNFTEKEFEYQSTKQVELEPSTETHFSEEEHFKETTTVVAHVETTTPTEQNLITSTEYLVDSEESEYFYTQTESFQNNKFTSSINIFDLLKNSSIEALSKLKSEILEQKPEIELEEEEGEDNFQMEEDGEDFEEEDRTLNDFKEIKKSENDQFLSIKEKNTTFSALTKISKDEEIYDYSQNCTEENINNNIIYHEHNTDSDKFIFCEKVNKAIVLICPLNMKWSQEFLQCLQNV